jgi:hypothetical protein
VTVALWQCRRAIGKTWGLRPKVVYWLYISVVKKTTQSSVVLKISRLQRLACMCVTGSMRSTPTSALETLLMLPPLGIFIEMESRQAVYRLKRIGRFKQARVGHSEVFTNMTEENPLLLAPSDKIEPTNVFGRKFSVEFPSRIEWLDPMSILPQNGT